MHEAAAQADYLINVLPAAPYNFALFDAAVFAAMKPSAYYISAGRGQTVDETALLAALRERRIAGAALDVFETEPKVPPALLKMKNVVLTPHLGSAVMEVRDLMANTVVDNIQALIDGRLPPNCVNPQMLKRS